MKINLIKKNDTIIFHIIGEFDLIEERNLLTKTRAAVAEPIKAIAIDLRDIKIINSIGITTLFSMFKFANEAGIEFILFGMNHQITAILQKILPEGLIPLLTIEEFESKYL